MITNNTDFNTQEVMIFFLNVCLFLYTCIVRVLIGSNIIFKNWQGTSSCMINKLSIAFISLPHFFRGPSCLLSLHPDIFVQTPSSLSHESDKHPSHD